MAHIKRLGSMPLIAFLVMVTCLLVADRTVAFIAQRILLYSDHRIAKAYAGGRHDDILILGNSVGNAMVLPHELSKAVGHSALTLAVHGLDAVAQHALVEDYLERNKPPKIALLELRTVSVSLIRANEFLLFSSGDSSMAALNSDLAESMLPWNDIFHMHRLNSPLLPNTLQRLVDRRDQTGGVTDGQITPGIIAEFEKNSAKERVIFDRQKAAFIASLQAFSAAGTQPFVVIAPLHPVARIQTREMLANVMPQLPRGIPVCDFSTLLDEEKFYRDPTHLNSAGRESLLPYLIALIEQNWVKDGGADDPVDTPSDAEVMAVVQRLCITSEGAAL